MQKDGGDRRHGGADHALTPKCDYSGECGDVCGDMVRPRRASLLLHEHESKYCFPDYPDRHVFDWKEFDLPNNTFSLIMAVKVAQYMGCTSFKCVCCDVHAIGNYTRYDLDSGRLDPRPGYLIQRHDMQCAIDGLDVGWITPSNKNAIDMAKRNDPKISFGCITNDAYRFNTVLLKSALPGKLEYIINPESATKGLNKLLDVMTNKGFDVAVLSHQDMHFRQGWFEKMKGQLALLPDNWVVAGIIGKDLQGRICGKIHDMRIVENINTDKYHKFPQPACCMDECVIIVNLKSGFRFDEALDGFDLYGTLCVLQAWEMGGTAWIIDAWAEHYCMRPFSWFPDDTFKARYKWLYDRYNEKFEKIDSTAFVSKPRFETSAA
jgi:hypothetical protein